MNKSELTDRIRQKAFDLGFSLFGVSNVQRLDDDAEFLKQWLKDGKHGTMSWMENHFEKRVDPAKLVPGAKTVVSLGLNYFPEIPQPDTSSFRISKYAYGRDYHKLIRKKLKTLMAFIRELDPAVEGRMFVDSAPVMERKWAAMSGLGWVGKNTLLINRKQGSFFFLSELITNLELEPTSPVKDLCKTCRLCVDACPTGALNVPYQLDASRCISYLTIENKELIPGEFEGKLDHWIFGCDICQDVCPWNRNATPHNEPALNPMPHLFALSDADWQRLSEESFEKLFAGSPVRRTGFNGLKRNIEFNRKRNE